MTPTIRIRGPFSWTALLGYFAARAIHGVEHVVDGVYHRVGDAGATVSITFLDDAVRTTPAAPAARVRRLLGLDVDHGRAIEALRGDPVIGPRILRQPGMRVPGTWDPFETGVRAIIGQQVSVAGASTVAGRVVARYGTPVQGPPVTGLRHAFPSPEVLADADLSGLGLTGQRIAAIQGFAAAVADGAIVLDRNTALEALIASITAVRGLGPWTAHYLAIRLGHEDAFPVADLGLQRAAGLDAKALTVAAERWRPHRALAAVHLWETPLDGPAAG